MFSAHFYFIVFYVVAFVAPRSEPFVSLRHTRFILRQSLLTDHHFFFTGFSFLGEMHNRRSIVVMRSSAQSVCHILIGLFYLSFGTMVANSQGESPSQCLINSN